MVEAVFSARFTDRRDDRDACIAAFEQHDARVRREVPSDSHYGNLTARNSPGRRLSSAVTTVARCLWIIGPLVVGKTRRGRLGAVANNSNEPVRSTQRS